MNKRRDYLPRANDAFYIFAQTLVAIVVASGAGWGLAAAVINAFQAQFATYQAAYNAQVNKYNRTPAQVAAHLTARALFEGQLRAFVKEHLINSSAITYDEKISMRLNPREGSKSPRPVIDTAPLLHVSAKAGCVVHLECRVVADENRPSIHGDADGVEVRYSVDAVPATWKAAKEVKLSSRARFKLTFEPDEEGKVVYLYARWFNKTDDKKSGPFCTRQQVKLIA